jgi:hypothetical protein
LACLDDARLAGEEDVLRNFAARFEREAGQRHAVRTASQLEFEPVLLVGEHDEAALGPGHLDRRIEHQREDVVQDAARTERAQPLEQASHVTDLARRRHSTLVLRRLVVADQEHELRLVGITQPDPITMPEDMCRRLRAVDVGAEFRVAVAQAAGTAFGGDLRVVT